jgi:hypothetical protein
MAPDPSVDSQQDESYLFQGTAQTAVEGDPVPIVYGKLRVPGRPISFEVRNRNQAFISIASSDTATPPSQEINIQAPPVTGNAANVGGQQSTYIPIVNINFP